MRRLGRNGITQIDQTDRNLVNNLLREENNEEEQIVETIVPFVGEGRQLGGRIRIQQFIDLYRNRIMNSEEGQIPFIRNVNEIEVLDSSNFEIINNQMSQENRIIFLNSVTNRQDIFIDELTNLNNFDINAIGRTSGILNTIIFSNRENQNLFNFLHNLFNDSDMYQNPSRYLPYIINIFSYYFIFNNPDIFNQSTTIFFHDLELVFTNFLLFNSHTLYNLEIRELRNTFNTLIDNINIIGEEELHINSENNLNNLNQIQQETNNQLDRIRVRNFRRTVILSAVSLGSWVILSQMGIHPNVIRSMFIGFFENNNLISLNNPDVDIRVGDLNNRIIRLRDLWDLALLTSYQIINKFRRNI